MLSLPQIAKDDFDPNQRHLPPNRYALDSLLPLCGVEAWVYPSISKEIQMVHVVVPGAGLGGMIAAYKIRSGTSEPFYERLAMLALGINTLKEVKLD